MERRDFVTSAIAMAGAALSGGEARAMAQPKQEFYLLRKYALRNGPQLALTQNYLRACPDSGAQSDVDHSGWCVQIGYWARDA